MSALSVRYERSSGKWDYYRCHGTAAELRAAGIIDRRPVPGERGCRNFASLTYDLPDGRHVNVIASGAVFKIVIVRVPREWRFVGFARFMVAALQLMSTDPSKEFRAELEALYRPGPAASGTP